MELLVFDIGGSAVKYGLWSASGGLTARGSFPTPYEGGISGLLGGMRGVCRDIGGGAVGCAVSMPGMLDSAAGYAFTGGCIGYLAETPFSSMVSEALSLPTVIENDGKCAALSELGCGALAGCENGAVVILGTGVGGGLILGGRLYKGRHFSAGEFSYAAVSETEKYSFEGYWGCVGGVGSLIKGAAERTGIAPKELDGRRVFDMAESGDERALEAIREYTSRLATQLYNINVLLDLDVIAVGGGISRRPLLHELLKRSLDEYLAAHPMLVQGSYLPRPNVVCCRFAGESNLIGAAYAYAERYGLS